MVTRKVRMSASGSWARNGLFQSRDIGVQTHFDYRFAINITYIRKKRFLFPFLHFLSSIFQTFETHSSEHSSLFVTSLSILPFPRSIFMGRLPYRSQSKLHRLDQSFSANDRLFDLVASITISLYRVRQLNGSTWYQTSNRFELDLEVLASYLSINFTSFPDDQFNKYQRRDHWGPSMGTILGMMCEKAQQSSFTILMMLKTQSQINGPSRFNPTTWHEFDGTYQHYPRTFLKGDLVWCAGRHLKIWTLISDVVKSNLIWLELNDGQIPPSMYKMNTGSVSFLSSIIDIIHHHHVQITRSRALCSCHNVDGS